MDVGSKITKIRTAQGLSLTNLAKLSGIAQSSLSYIESGKAQPTVETLNKICATLGISLAEFFADDQEPVSIPPHLKRLLDQSRDLTPEQVEQLNKFIVAMKK